MKWWIFLGILCIIIFLGMYCYKQWSKERPIEGFQVATYRVPGTWNIYKITGSSYTIYDPEALYIQAKMYRYTLHNVLDLISTTEKEALDFISSDLTEYKRWRDRENGKSNQDDYFVNTRIATYLGVYGYRAVFKNTDISGNAINTGGTSCPDECDYPEVDPSRLRGKVRTAILRVMTYYYTKLIDLGISNRLRSIYHEHIYIKERLGDWDLGYTRIAKAYLKNVLKTYDTEVIHKNFENHPVGKFLAKIQTDVHKFSFTTIFKNLIYREPQNSFGVEDTLTWGKPVFGTTRGAIAMELHSLARVNNLSLTTNDTSGNVLLTPGDWSLVDIITPWTEYVYLNGVPTLVDITSPYTQGHVYARGIRDRFLSKKGLTMTNQTGILTKTIQINGSMSSANMFEINESIFYMMHFNFSDISTISKQIAYGLINKRDEFVEDFLDNNDFSQFGTKSLSAADLNPELYNSPEVDSDGTKYSYNTGEKTGYLSYLYNAGVNTIYKSLPQNIIKREEYYINKYRNRLKLYMCKTFNFEDDNKYVKSDYNINRAQAITQDIINVLTYDALDLISKYGNTARTTLLQTLKNIIINQQTSTTDHTLFYNVISSKIAFIESDITANSYYPSRTINLSSYLVPYYYTYIQTKTRIYLNNIVGNSNVTFSITPALSYFTDNIYDMTKKDVYVYAIDTNKKIHSFNAKIKSYTSSGFNSKTSPNYNSITITLDCSNVTLSNINDPSPQIFTNNTTEYTFTLQFQTPINTRQLQLTTTQTNSVLNAIAQCFYNLNNGNIKMTNILDVHQVGNTIFDVRFRVSEIDPAKTSDLLGKLSTLKDNYDLYRNYDITQKERVELDLNYNTQSLKIMSDLKKAIIGYSDNSDPNCGQVARYIRILCTGDICLSQIEVVDYTNQNVAINSNITYGKYNSYESKIYPYEDPSGQTLGEGSTATMNANYVESLEKTIKMKHINSLVDGTIEARYEPDIYEMVKGSTLNDNNYLEIDLGYETNICYVRLTFPLGKSINTSQYTIELKNAQQVSVNDYRTYSMNTKFVASFTDPTKTNCPSASTIKYNPYWVARFYADIQPTNPSNYLQVNNSYIKFTGYSGGQTGTPDADAVLSFNPMYNGGFVKDLESMSGIFNYQPKIAFSNTSDVPNINCQTEATKIMQDYMTNISHPDFIRNNSGNYLNGYNYYVSTITNYADDTTSVPNAKACKIRWNEIQVEAVTNKIINTIPRTGKFVYIKNIYDWKISTTYYDPSNSTILPGDTSAMNQFSPQIQMSIPTIPEVFLEGLNERCGNKTCSDLDVIDSLIHGYNTKASDTILRVSKAVTPTPTQCEFECYTRSSSDIPKRIRMNIRVDFDSANWRCTYTHLNSQFVNETTGTYIQSNTPFLTQVYNYTTEMMSEFKKSLNDVYTNLSTMVQPHISGDGMTSAVVKYRQDTWGAFGEIKGLSTCSLQCGDPQVIYNFLSKYRNFSKRVAAIKGFGTFNSNTCDYMIDETTMSISAGGTFVESSPVSAIYRATMNGCAVTSTENITAQNTASQILLVNRSSLDYIDLSGVIRSNYISFSDTLTIAVTTAPPAWIQVGTPVYIESASSYLEANVQSKSATTITFYNFFNPRGDFNQYVSSTGPTITGDVPSWLKNGVKVQIFSDPVGTRVHDGTINISGITITQPTLTATTKYNIFLYENYTISNATPTQPSTAGSWVTPITLGTGLYNGASSLQVEAGSTSYNPGQPFLLVNKFFNTPASFSEKVMNVTITPPSWLTSNIAIIISTKMGGIQIYNGSIFSVSGNQITLNSFPSIEALLSNPSDSYNIYIINDTAVVIGTIQSYSGTNLVLNITSGGSLFARTSYTIQQTARPKSYPSIPKAFSPIDWIDCSSEFAKKSTGQTSLTQTAVDTCNTYIFTRPAGSDTLKYNNITPSGLTAMTCTTRINTLINTIGYPVAENESLVSGSTYEYRVTTLNTLPFDQTYKRITFYGNCQISEIKGADIATSSNKNGNPLTNATTYANFFRHWWNITYYYASKIQNKRVMGDIDGYYYDTNTDSVIFRCKSAEFGQNGPADILKYNESVSSFPTYAYYQIVFRRKYGQTGTMPALGTSFTSVDSISSNYMIYSVISVAVPPSIIAITSAAVDTTTYTGMINRDTSNYIAQLPSIALSNQFRFLRFQVTASNAADYAEITRIYFYKLASDGSYDNSFKESILNTTLSAVSNNIITLVQAVPIWLKENIIIKIRLSSGGTNIYTGPVLKINGQQLTLDSNVSLVTSTSYHISFYDNYGTGIFLQSARFRMSDISSNYYNYQNTDCSGGYLKIPNPYKTSYNICAVATRKDTSTRSIYEYTKTGTCSIGYVDYNDSYQKTYTADTQYTTDTNKCITTGLYGEVNTILVNANISTKRLRLKINQYLLIDLGDLLTINAYTFITGSASRLPTAFQLEGSYNGVTWKTLNTQTGFTYPSTKSTFYVPGYFSTTGGATQALITQPSFYNSQAGNTAFEGFKNPVAESALLEPFIDKTPYFKPDETALEPRYALPLSDVRQVNTLYQPLNTQARRIKTMKFRVLETHDPDAKFVHMSMFQFHTSAGPMKSSMVRISNPMGSRRSPSDSPESLLEPTTKARWVDYNKMPLIFTFIEYPQAQIIGFQFAFPDTSNHMAALPSRWKMEGSYDGRNWEIYHEKTEKAQYIGNASPIYKFKTEI
jgi:hypothetical protein